MKIACFNNFKIIRGPEFRAAPLNVSAIFTLLLALFLVSTSSWGGYLPLKLQNAPLHSVASCLLGLSAIWWVFRVFFWKQLPGVTENCAMRVMRVIQNSSIVRQKTKNSALKDAKKKAPLNWGKLHSWVTIHYNGALSHFSNLIHCYYNKTNSL